MRTLVAAYEHPWPAQRRVAPPVVLFPGTLQPLPNVTPPGAWSAGSLRQSTAGFPMPASESSGWGVPVQASLHRPPATTVVGPVPDIVTEGQVTAMAQAAGAAP
jgi:hypothetical protein